jgi:hypothetical protein
MAYVPKNKIQTNLYTPGEEFTKKISNEFYIGFYYKLYNGTYFTGKNINDGPNDELVRVGIIGPIDENISKENKLSLYNPILPTEQDYQVGEFTRYFSIKRNQSIFTEISKDTFDQYQQKSPQVNWKLYRVFSLFWQLKGDINKVTQTNKNITELTENREKAFGLSIYLKENWIQYYKS